MAYEKRKKGKRGQNGVPLIETCGNIRDLGLEGMCAHGTLTQTTRLQNIVGATPITRSPIALAMIADLYV